ncbi:Cyclic nucleotide-binding domain-containing protein [Pedococcus cremeus]|uniref:Cyclic nucleotide-binding domain-containing protein n=1 Tax=Pedococcus cremeus TaxID=587636 RepID=A0A1H9TLM3_9MICO|nr:cyclic nucleotide-binding domain-containing protein [Pedococcus cremeus]SER97894.1 Cyclic nucleotide-binding domain-containing protein [Pedococcus cremeus]
MQTITDYLPQHPFFAGLPEPVVALVAGCAVNVHFRPGQHLFHEGEPADTFYVIRHGRVSLEVRAPAGSPVVVDSAHADDVVGWSWLVPPHRWLFDARATEETSAIAFDGACLRDKCDTDPAVGYALLQRVVQVMSTRLQSARIRLLDVYGAPV